MTDLPTLADWQARAPALELRRRGRELVGPCPAYGGKDRFRVTGSGKFFCRQCCPNGRAGGSAMRRVLEAAGLALDQGAPDDRRREPRRRRGDSRGPRDRSHGQSPARATRESAPRTNSDDAAKVEAARGIWAAGVPAEGTLARRYLAGRLAWPPDGIGPTLPASVRWLPRDRAPASTPEAGWHGLPAGAVGAALYRLSVPPSITAAAVNLEALDADGRRLAKRWRRTFGIQTGSAFKARAAASEANPVHVVEGYCDALALALAPWCGPGAIYAMGGTAGLQHQAAVTFAATGAGALVIHADGGRPGREAAEHARHEIEATGRACRVEWYADDPAEALADWLRERAASREHEGGADRKAAERGAWMDLLQEIAP